MNALPCSTLDETKRLAQSHRKNDIYGNGHVYLEKIKKEREKDVRNFFLCQGNATRTTYIQAFVFMFISSLLYTKEIRREQL